MCKSAFYHLRKIRLIRKHLTFDAAQLLVQALVTSKLDYCNSLLYGLAKNVIKQLQRVQNAAARVVTLSPKFCHITPVLANLHWLSIYLRIEFKILIVTCKPLHGLAPAYIKMFFCVTSRNGILGLQRKIYLSCLLLTWTVMAGELFLFLRRFFGIVFLSILGMLDHWTFLKDSWKLFFFFVVLFVLF